LVNYDINSAICIHRLGNLQIGDMAVWVGVNGAHRDAAFEACRFVIDEIKLWVPIWKKEYYLDSTLPLWVGSEVIG
jgi:molybdopterin synthase catalytic subunit